MKERIYEMVKRKPIKKDNTSSHWKRIIHLKKCSFQCDNAAVHYHKLKFYCKECYEKLIKEIK